MSATRETKKAIAVQPVRTKLANKEIKPGEEFEDLASRVDALIDMGAATAIDADPPPQQPQSTPAEEFPGPSVGAGNVDAFLGGSVAAPSGQGGRRGQGARRGVEG